jgi:hypothetical protein
MTSINIRRDVQDSFYRYKMPKLQAKVPFELLNFANHLAF